MKTELLRASDTSLSLASVLTSGSDLNHDPGPHSYTHTHQHPNTPQDRSTLNSNGTGSSSVTTGHNHNCKLEIAKNKKNDVGCLESIRDWSRSTFQKKLLYRKLPILHWLPDYNFSKMVADMIAGITVALTLLPQGLAYATIARVPHQMGLYSAFIGSFVYIFFGSTKYVSIGPTAGLAIASASYTAAARVEYTILICFLTGLVTLAMGLLQLGFLVNFISLPTLSGFTSAIAITICSTQFSALLGLKFESDGFLEMVQGTISRIPETRMYDAILSLTCVVTILFLQHVQLIFKGIANRSKIMSKILWFLSTARSGIVVIVCMIIFSLLDDQPVRLVGHIIPGLPTPACPPFMFSRGNNATIEEYSIGDLLGNGGTSLLIVVPLLAIMEHITIAKSTAGTGSRLDCSQEMLTIGLSNLIGSFFGSIPVTGSFSYTTVNFSSGVKTPMGCLATGVAILLSLQFLTPYFYFIPNATLAAVIVSSVAFRIDFSIVRSMWNSKKMDIIPWFGTFLISLLVGLQYGILFGVVISILYLLYYTARPRISVEKGMTCSGVPFIIVHLDRSLVFPSMEYTCYIIKKAGQKWALGKLPVVMDCKHIQFSDYTAAQGIKDIFHLFNERKQDLILWRLKPSVVRLITGVMSVTHTPFRHCSTEIELEDMIDATRIAIRRKSEGRVTFQFDPSDFGLGPNQKDEYLDSDYDEDNDKDESEVQVTINSMEGQIFRQNIKRQLSVSSNDIQPLLILIWMK